MIVRNLRFWFDSKPRPALKPECDLSLLTSRRAVIAGIGVLPLVAADRARAAGNRLKLRTMRRGNQLFSMVPSPAFTGTYGSGYDNGFGTTPSSIPRTGPQAVAKTLQTDEFVISASTLIGVRAGAYGDAANGGIASVTFCCEGNEYVVTAPTRETFTDARGNSQGLTGWFVKLDPADLAGHPYGELQIYMVITPTNPAVLAVRRGPYRYYFPDPANTAFGRELVFGTGLSVTTGVQYADWNTAAKYARNQGWICPTLRCTVTGDYWLAKEGTSDINVGSNTTAKGRIRTIAAPGVTCQIGLNSPPDWMYRRFTTGYNGLHFQGEGVVIDQKNIQWIYWDSGDGSIVHWFDGIQIINSMGQYALFDGHTPGENFSRSAAIYTECDIANIRGNKLADNVGLMRNCTVTGIGGDIVTLGNCVVGNTFHSNWNSAYRTGQSSMTIAYNGAGAGTISRTGTAAENDGSLVLKVDGSTVATIALGVSPFADNNNRLIQSVCDDINAVSNWAAVNLHDDDWTTIYDRAAKMLTTSSGGGSGSGDLFTNVSVTSTPVTLYTSFDAHADWNQITTSSRTNIVFADNITYDNEWQWIFHTGASTTVNDALYENNTNYFVSYSGSTTSLQSQIACPWTHVLFRHNVCLGQSFLLKDDSTTFTHDAYSEIYGNVFTNLNTLGTVSATLADSNHCFASSAIVQAQSTNLTSGGSNGSCFVDVANGDFTPQGELASNLITPHTPFDALGTRRAAADARGAIALAA